MSAVCGFGLYFLFALASPAAGLPLLGAGAIIATLPLIYRATAAAGLCGRTLAAVVCAITAWVAWARGGYPTSALAFLSVVPLIVVYLLDRREAVLWTVLSSTLAIGFYARAAAGDAAGVTARPDQLDLVLETAGVVGLLAVVFALAYAHQAGRERSENARKAAQRQLALSERLDSVGQLAGGVAHDFNNILSVILNTTQLALQDLATGTAVAKSDLEAIQTAARRAADFTRQLLVFSRREVARPQAIDVVQLIQTLLPLLRRTIPENIEIDLQFDAGVGLVQGDPTQIERVLLNLAVNARDAMPGGGLLTIEVDAVRLDAPYHREGVHAPAGPYVAIAVSDSGAGISPDVVGRIFEPFFTTKGRGIGSGLGLATVYGIVRRSNGFIWVDTERGSGTTFTIWFPEARQATAPIAADEPAVAPAPRLEGRGRLLLLVEDEPAVRETTSRVLVGHGYEVIAAQNGEEALKLFGEHKSRIAVVLSDVVMPGMSGAKLAEELRRLTPNLPVVLMSGYADAEDTEGVKRLGVPLLSKPVSPAELLGTIAKALSTLQ